MENHVSETLEPLWPPENVTRSATRTAASTWLPILMSTERTRIEVPRMKTGPMERWLLLPVHATAWDVPGTMRPETAVTAGRQTKVDVSSTWNATKSQLY